MKRSKKRNRKKYRILNIFVSFILLSATSFLLYTLYKSGMLGTIYFIITAIVVAIIDLILINILNRKFRIFIKVPFLIITLLLIGISIFGIYNLNNTADFIKHIAENAGIKEEIYTMYVLNESKYNKISDLDGHDIGIHDNKSDLLEDAIKTLNKKVTVKSEEKYSDLDDLLNAGINRKVEAVFISNSMKELMEENYKDLISKYREVGSITVTKKEKIEGSSVNVTKEPFIIYISGIDTKGSINSVGRSDVNMLAVINPKENKILLVHTPRDYYVKLHSKEAYDKLTHSGIYGIEESLNTMEDLYAADIDFYFKINFSSVIALVDSINGITVDVPMNFCEQDSSRRFGSYQICLKKGEQTLNGEEALALARHRHSLSNGDMGRGSNQELVIKAIIDKITSPSIISKYSTILNTMQNHMVTNMNEKSITKLAKHQISKNPNWTIESANVTGTNAYRSTYSGGRTSLAVVLPDDNSITEAKQKIFSYLGENTDEE